LNLETPAYDHLHGTGHPPMTKWLISDGIEGGKGRRTIIDADTENAAMQIARTALGKAATWKALTDDEAAGMARLMENIDEARDVAGQMGRHAAAWIANVKAHYNRSGVPDSVYDALCAMALNTGRNTEATEPPYPEILDAVIAQAEMGNPHWAACAARMQQYIWEGHDRHGAELVGFDQLLHVSDGGVPVDVILSVLADFYAVPEDSRPGVAGMVVQLNALSPAELGVMWAGYYAHVLRTIFAACEFELDDR
jgi:hypothetical protein